MHFRLKCFFKDIYSDNPTVYFILNAKNNTLFYHCAIVNINFFSNPHHSSSQIGKNNKHNITVYDKEQV